MNPESLLPPCAPSPTLSYAEGRAYRQAQPAGYGGRVATAAELQTLADRAAEREASIAAQDALAAELDKLADIASAGIHLIVAVRNLRVYTQLPDNYASLAKYRKELQPQANALGCKIVLVGDRTTATVVLL